MARILLVVLGLGALVMAGFAAWIGWTSRSAAAKLRRLPAIDSDGLETVSAGEAGFLEGRLADHNAVDEHGFVFHTRSRLVGLKQQRGATPASSSSTEPIWRTISVTTPTLWVETAEDTFRIIGRYAVTYLGSDPSVWTTETLVVGETERIDGLPRGHRVTVVGTVVGDAEGRAILAERVVSGDRDSALDGDDAATTFGLAAALVLAVAGVVILTVAARI